jgi:hypothetical protein
VLRQGLNELETFLLTRGKHCQARLPLFEPRLTAYLLVGGIALFVLVVIVVAILVVKVRYTQQRKALAQLLERYHQCGQALVRYVMINRQCSEEIAFQHIARFVKKHVPLDEHSCIDRMLALDRQSLIDRTQSILVQAPDELDKI